MKTDWKSETRLPKWDAVLLDLVLDKRWRRRNWFSITIIWTKHLPDSATHVSIHNDRDSQPFQTKGCAQPCLIPRLQRLEMRTICRNFMLLTYYSWQVKKTVISEIWHCFAVVTVSPTLVYDFDRINDAIASALFGYCAHIRDAG
jgi:hypothetical protein